MRKKWIAGCLAGMLAAMSLSGCAASTDTSHTEYEAVQYNAIERSNSAGRTGDEGVLRIGYDTELLNLQPLYAVTPVEQELVSLTQETLFAVDRSGGVVRKGISGELIAYNGVDYAYRGLADVEIERDEESNFTVYHITLRRDARFADGEKVDADDLIFTLYLLSDTSYEGPYTLYQAPITGMTNYRLDAPADVVVEEKEITRALQEMDEELAARITREVILPVLKEEFAWCQSLYESSDYDMLTKQYGRAEDLFYYFYGLGDACEENGGAFEYEADEAAEETKVIEFLEQVAKEYEGDYRKLGQIYAGDEDLYEKPARRIGEEYLIAKKIASGQKGKAPNISGIQRVSDYRVDIYTNGYDETCIYRLNVPVLPLHYYGDLELYDYNENQFGFTKGDLSELLSRNRLPMGAGAYQMTDSREDRLCLTSNQEYYKGKPAIDTIEYWKIEEEEKIPLLAAGKIDVVHKQDNQVSLKQIQAENSNGAITGDVIYTSLSDALEYGYIGMNSETVNVAGRGDSKASRALRTGLGVMLAYYREEAVSQYFGGTAGVLDYPVSRAFSIAPKPSDEGYRSAYSRDIRGYELYTQDMDEEERKEAMENAVLEYLKEAGYSIRGGRVVRVPEGGSDSFEVLIAAEDLTGAPFYTLLLAAREHLEELGITLHIKNVKTEKELLEALSTEEYQIWCGVKKEAMYPDLYASFGSGSRSEETENLYHAGGTALDKKLMELKGESDPANAGKLYYECLEMIMEQAIEVPVYQCRSCVLFSGKRVNADTIAEDTTGFYTWLQEIERLKFHGDMSENETDG